MTREQQTLLAQALRDIARAMFDDQDLDMIVRDSSWVCADSYDTGLVTAAKYLLHRADRIEAGE